jgi:hypothetical protein
MIRRQMKIEYKKLNAEDVKSLLETGYFGETERSFTYTTSYHNFYKTLIANEEMTDGDIDLILQATTGVAFGDHRFMLDQLVDFVGYKGHLLELEESPAGNPSVFRDYESAIREGLWNLAQAKKLPDLTQKLHDLWTQKCYPDFYNID